MLFASKTPSPVFKRGLGRGHQFLLTLHQLYPYRMRIGIIFGGPSREREISFAGGRTVFDNLDKTLFEAVPVFVDSLGNFILLDWHFIYKGTIRDFYPPVDTVPHSAHHLQIYLESLGELEKEELDEIIAKVGKKIQPHKFKEYFDFAFLALHGPYGEDGNIQGLLEWYRIPYSGSGILASAIGIDKIVQKQFMQNNGFASPSYSVIPAELWDREEDRPAMFEQLTYELGLPLVLKAPHQGSSIGVSVLKDPDFEAFETAVNKSFFTRNVSKDDWQELDNAGKVNLVKQLTDIREGIGLPVIADDETEIYHPEELLKHLQSVFTLTDTEFVSLTNVETEPAVLVESFIRGKEFSCIVVQDADGKAVALPPTEIVKGNDVFDYRSKYLPGLSRKITPIDLPE